MHHDASWGAPDYERLAEDGLGVCVDNGHSPGTIIRDIHIRASRVNCHTKRPTADWERRPESSLGCRINDRHRIVTLIGDIHPFSIATDCDSSWMLANWNWSADHSVRGSIKYGDGIS
jgi:hypothetical protein